MSKYNVTFCVKCGQKTEWTGPVNLKMTRNKVPTLRGKCCKCRCNKSTFVTKCFYKREQRKRRGADLCRK